MAFAYVAMHNEHHVDAAKCDMDNILHQTCTRNHVKHHVNAVFCCIYDILRQPHPTWKHVKQHANAVSCCTYDTLHQPQQTCSTSEIVGLTGLFETFGVVQASDKVTAWSWPWCLSPGKCKPLIRFVHRKSLPSFPPM